MFLGLQQLSGRLAEGSARLEEEKAALASHGEACRAAAYKIERQRKCVRRWRVRVLAQTGGAAWASRWRGQRETHAVACARFWGLSSAHPRPGRANSV